MEITKNKSKLKKKGRNSLIEYKDVVKKYDGDTLANDHISLKIEQGDFVYVVGPSGAGKSTFIKMMYHEEVPTSGHIKVNDHNLESMKNNEVPFLRRELGIVFQDFKLLPRLTVFENVAYALHVIEKEPKEVEKRVAHVLDLVGLADKKDSFPDALSGGEQQRVAIARAIANKPTILIADEPTGNLDSKNSSEILELLKYSNKKYNQTLIMITHDLNIAKQADRMIKIQDGKISSDEKIK